MSFIRIKHIGENEYAYLVENTWTERGSRQRTKQYLGRVLQFESRPWHYELRAMEFTSLVYELVEIELLKHGFEKRDNGFYHTKIRVRLNPPSFKKGNRDIVLQFNEGFLCSDTLRSLTSFTPATERFERDLANALLAAGIGMPSELFINLYEAAKKRLIKPSA